MAQLVEQLIRNQQVVGSSPIFSSKAVFPFLGMPLSFYALELYKQVTYYYILTILEFQP